MTNTKKLQEIKGTDTIASTWQYLLERDRNVSNLFSGTDFTADQDPVQDIGRPNWRIDQKKLYIYEGNNPDGTPKFTNYISLTDLEDIPFNSSDTNIPSSVSNLKELLDFLSARQLLNAVVMPATSNLYVGDGSTFTYSLPEGTGNQATVHVYIDGVKQASDTYNLSTDGKSISLIEAPAAGERIEIILNNSLLEYNYAPVVSQYTGNGAVKEFTFPIEVLNPTTVSVNIDGKELQKTDFSIGSDQKTIILPTAPETGSKIQIMTVGKTTLVSPSPNSVGTTELKNGSVTSDKLAANVSINPNSITDGTLSGSKLVNGSIVQAKLGESSVGTNQVSDGAITFTKLAKSVNDKLNDLETRIRALELNA